jgi:trans-aconitate methyltransferase
MERRDHWNRVYETRTPDSVSWFQVRPALSLDMIAAASIRKDAGIIDVGGGASVLVDCLLERGYTNLAVLDLSGAALKVSRSRLGAKAAAVHWIEADVTSFEPPRRYALWHDRAVFHFLTDGRDRAGYKATLRKALQPDGAVIIATFAPDGPPKCSGLDVMRYDAEAIAAALGDEFQLHETRRETHVTPAEAEQRFNYFRFSAVAT